MGNIDNPYKPFGLVTVYKKDLANIYNLVLQIKNEINEIEDERIKQINETLNEIFIRLYKILLDKNCVAMQDKIVKLSLDKNDLFKTYNSILKMKDYLNETFTDKTKLKQVNQLLNELLTLLYTSLLDEDYIEE